MGALKVEGNYLSPERRRKIKLYITHTTRNSGQVGDLTAVAKRIFKNNMQQIKTIYMNCWLNQKERNISSII